MRHGNNRLLAGAALASSLFTGGGCVEPTAGPPFVESVSQPLSASGSLELVANYNTTMTHGAVAAASMTSARFVTVGKAGATGQLHLGLWQLKDGGSVRSLASLTTSTKVGLTLDVARVDDKRFVVAARRADGDYYLGAFSIDPTTNAIKQTDDEERGAIDDISITGMNPVPGDLVIGAPSGAASEGHVVVAHRSSISGELGLTDYSITAAGLLRRNGSASGGTYRPSRSPRWRVVSRRRRSSAGRAAPNAATTASTMMATIIPTPQTGTAARPRPTRDPAPASRGRS